ncbi:MAG TPA: hypothetical protein VM692_01555 [Gammaproteobacteria bacterium]|nr:hypothetical protein [Gammaproteobacteria bacterium]
MNISGKIPTALLALLCGAVTLAQEGASPAPPATPPRAPAPAPAGSGDKADTAPAPDQRPEVKDDEFIPTEELQPDAAVTFPVDI